MAETIAAALPPGVFAIGVDEDTAIISDGTDFKRWVVHGRQAAWVLHAEGRTPYRAGEEIAL